MKITAKASKKVWLAIISCVFALFLALGAFFTTLGFENLVKSARAESERVTMLDLMGRYPVDYVLGPVDVVDTNNDNKIDRNDIGKNGKYTYKDTNFVKDSDGNPVLDEKGNKILTNNTYGLPAEKYFDVESYIYAEGIKDSEAGRILRGWKPDIHSVEYNVSGKRKQIAENGEIMDGSLGDSASSTGIYVQFAGSGMSGTSIKYALIVPKDIVKVGKGSAAYVANGKKYFTKSELPDEFNTHISEPAVEGDFTDFGCFIMDQSLGHGEEAPWFWQPRERLAGVYFPDDSRLTEIEGTDAAHAQTEQQYNRTTKADIGKSAFMGCGLSFMVLPGANSAAKTTGLKTIGDYAFYRTGIVDANIPSSVTSLGDFSYAACGSLLYIDKPSITIPSNTFKDCPKLTKYAGKTLYVMGGAPHDGVLDTGRSGFLFAKSGSTWSAVALAGETGEDEQKVFIFPDEEDFNETSDRRTGVEYDYIDCDGYKRRNSFEGFSGTYSIADSFANDVWCRKIILPEACTAIGASAFYNSRVDYLETYATTIGANAFAGKTETVDQWFYFHKTRNEDGSYTVSDYNIDSSAFVASGGTRHVIFENYELYSAFNGSYGHFPSGTKHYQIPVIANIYSEDSTGVTVKVSDMTDRFFNDSDYVENPTTTVGSNAITYTKRLSGYPFKFVKYATGVWGENNDIAPYKMPTLSNMVSTVWYQIADSDLTDLTKLADSATYQTVTNAEDLYNQDSSTEVNIYTKKIKMPEAVDQKWTFDEEMKKAENADTYSFANLLGLSSVDYTVTYKNHINPWKQTSAINLDWVSAAGDYTLNIALNKDKWGEWDSLHSSYDVTKTEVTATVKQQEIDLGNIANLPKFYALSSKGNEPLGKSEKTTLYEVIDGWSEVESSGYLSSTEAVNSFVGYAGVSIQLGAIKGLTAENEVIGWDKYNVSSDGASQLFGLNSGRYTASFSLSVKDSNYKFIYNNMTGDSEETTKNLELFALNKMGFTSALERTAVLSKQWYILKSLNWLINAGSSETDPTKNVYKLAVKTDGSEEEISSWQYEFDGYKLNTPALANGNNGEIALTAAISLNGEPLTPTEGISVTELSRYINPVMPVGDYTVIIHAPEVTVGSQFYPEFDTSFTIMVKPGTLNVEEIKAFLTDEDTTKGQLFEKEYTGTLFLHDDIGDLLGELNGTIDQKIKGLSADADNYWLSESSRAKYYGDAVVKYNLDRLQKSTYYTYDYLAENNRSLADVNEYNVYYSISAPNYEQVGGEEANEARREYCFTTVIYKGVSAKELAEAIRATQYVYTGSRLEANVPYSADYQSSFVTESDDYTKVGTHTVTLTMNAPKLARWVEADGEGIGGADQLTRDSQIITITYEIEQATNAWKTAPSVPGWTYKGFDRTVYTIFGTLTYPGAEAYYRIGTRSETDDTFNWVDVGGEVEIDGTVEPSYFAVDENGAVSEDVEKILNALPAGTYYLGSYVMPTEDGNVSALATPTHSRIIVGKAVNRWVNQPAIIRWTWGEYDKTIHLISSEPLFNEADSTGLCPATRYSILTSEKQAITVEITLADNTKKQVTLSNFTEVTDEIALALAKLGMGKYYLRASKEGNANYFAITNTDVSFDIGRANNVWETTPGMTSWSYKAFELSNFIAGDPKYGDAETVVYTLTKQDGSAFAFGNAEGGTNKTEYTLTFTVNEAGVIVLGSETETALKNLPVGNYNLKAELKGTDNYTDLGYTVPFSVNQVDNTWNTAPVLTGWAFGRFIKSNFKAGVPTLNEVQDAKVVYTVKLGADNTWQEFAEFELAFVTEGDLTDETVKKLNGLKYGNYILNVTYVGNDNYRKINENIAFRVSDVANSWEYSPSITGWSYGTFKNEIFKAGTPALGFAKDVQYTVTYTAADGRQITIELAVNEDGTLEADSVTALNNLGVLAESGVYTLHAHLDGTAEYSELNYSASFRVSAVENSWNPAPMLTGWDYNNFRDTNFRAGEPDLKTTGQQVTYKLYRGSVESGMLLITFNGLSDNVTVGVTTQTVSQYLNALPFVEGGYTLVAEYPESTNYNKLSMPITFRVTKANNTWETTPVLTGWAFGQFRDTNFRAGEPDLKTTGQQVTYKLYRGATATGNALITFNTLTDKTGNGEETISDYLKQLIEDSYTLVASYPAGDNYLPLSQEITFAVSQDANSWATTPSMTAWQYDAFNADTNFVAGDPVYKKTGDSVQYAIFENRPTVTDFKELIAENSEKIFTNIASQDKDLKGLPVRADGYWLGVYYPGDDTKYSELFLAVSFSVSQATENIWQKRVTVSDWTYLNTPTAFTEGKATFGSDTATYTLAKRGSDGQFTDVANYAKIALDTLNSNLAGLGAGSYRLSVNIDATENYAAASDILYFTVEKANNTWQGNAAPSITKESWEFGSEKAGTVSSADVKYNDSNQVAIKRKFYHANRVNGALVADTTRPLTDKIDDDLTVDMPRDVGDYAVVFVAGGTDNFNELRHTVYFSITKYQNGWTEELERSLVWTWGSDDVMRNSKLVNATAKMSGKNDTVIYVVKSANGSYTSEEIEKADIIEFLQELGAGKYVLTVTLNVATPEGATANYTSVTSSADITVNEAAFGWEQELESSRWTWGVAEDQRTFKEPKATVKKTTDTVKYSFTVGKKGETATTAYEGYAALLDGIRALPAGSYTVTLTVSCDNYHSETASVALEISNATFTWGTNPAPSSWAWGDETKTVTEPVVTDIQGNAVTLEYTLLSKDGSTINYGSGFEALAAWLRNDDKAKANDYTVKVKAARDNYATSEKEFIVTIEVAENKWTTPPTESYTMEYHAADVSKITLGVAKFGENDGKAVYAYNGSEILDLEHTLNNLGTSDNAYVIKITVKGAEGKYNGLEAELKVLVKGIGSLWDNENDLKKDGIYTFTYADSDAFEQELRTVIVPLKQIDPTIGGSVTYSVTYKDLEGTNTDSATPSNAEGVIKYLTDKAETSYSSGVYTIVSNYKPNDGAYASLSWTITVTINRAADEWEDGLTIEEYYSESYQSITMPTPVAKHDRPVSISVTDAKGNDRPIPSDSNLHAFLNTLDVGQYTVKYSVAQSVNYGGISERTVRVNIIPAVNDWKSNQVFDNVAINRGETFDIPVPEAQRGTTYAVINGDTANKIIDINEYLNNPANKPAIGSFTVSFVVDGTNNYNGLNRSITVTISKRTLEWDTEPQNYGWTGAVDVNDFVTPIAKNGENGKNYNSLLRFDWRKSGASEKGNSLTIDAFKEALGQFVNGTYNVTVRIGGNYDAETTPETTKALFIEFNDYYNVLQTEIEIIVSKQANGFTTPLVNIEWHYGASLEAIGVVQPQVNAALSENAIVYTIRGKRFDGIELNEADYTFTSFKEFKEALATLPASKTSYVVSATITGTESYEGATSTVNYTVLQYVTKWTSGNEKTSYNLTYNEDYRFTEGDENNIPALTANYYEKYSKGSITWELYQGETKIENAIANISELINGCVRGKDFGTYRLVATLSDASEADFANNFAPLTFEITVNIARADNAWTDETTTETEITWTFGDPDNTNTPIIFEAVQNKDDLKFRIDGADEQTGELAAALIALPARATAYIVTVTVPEKGNYNGLSQTFRLTVNKAQNGWVMDATKPEQTQGVAFSKGNFASGEFKTETVIVGDKQIEKISWTWGKDDNNELKKPEISILAPKYGTQIIVTVYKLTAEGQKDPNFNELRFTINFVPKSTSRSAFRKARATEELVANESDLNALAAALAAFGEGDYRQAFEVPEGTNNTDLREDKLIHVDKATNVWSGDNGAPHISGWSFGGDRAIPDATPKYGNKNDVVFKYADYTSAAVNADGTLKISELENLNWSETQPSTQGKYFLRGYLAGSEYYTELYGYNTFDIAQGVNTIVDAVSVIPWKWNGYDKTVNLFSGSANHGVAVSFAIAKMNGQLEVSDFVRFSGTAFGQADIDNLKAFTYVEETRYVSDEIAALLNALKPGAYRLTATITGAEGYENIFKSTTFSVGEAANEWTARPNVQTFTYGETPSVTAGASKYGTIVYKITDKDNTVVESDFGADDLEEKIKGLDTGSYNLRAWVVADATNGCYIALPEYAVSFSIAKAANGWETEYSESISKAWSVIHDTENPFDMEAFYPALTTKLKEEGVADGDNVTYSLLTPDYESLNKNDLTYAQLIAELRDLPANGYVIRAYAGETLNYTATSYADTKLTISKHENKFKGDVPEGLTAQWQKGEGNANATVLDDFTIDAEYGIGTLTYKMDGEPYETLDAFKEAVAALGVRELPYTVTIAIAATDEYTGLTKELPLTVRPAANAWQEGWAADGSLTPAAGTSASWKWNTSVSWTRAIPKYGTVVRVDIRLRDAITGQNFNVDYSIGNGDSVVGQIGTYISGLDTGVYDVTITAPAGANWTELTASTSFTITTAANGWTTDPEFNGAQKNEADGSWSWTYGTNVNAYAVAQYGATRYEFFDKDGKKLDGMPTAADKGYKARFFVASPETENYDPLETEVTFSIGKADNKAFESFGAIGWIWNEYDRKFNLFAGIPVTGGEVLFKVLRGGGVVTVDGFKLENIALVDEFGVHTGDQKKDLYVPEATGKLLNKLTAGTYTLNLSVAETDNYNGFDDASTTFVVTEAVNGWTTVPGITTWHANHWVEETNSPRAESRYGIPTVIITSRISGKTYYKAVYDPETGKYEATTSLLNTAEPGMYDMKVSVPAELGKYSYNGGELTAQVEFQLFAKGSTDEKNYWVDTPGISGWTANLLGIYSTPVGSAARGLMHYLFYTAVWNGESYEQGDLITAESEYFVKVDKEGLYYDDWYVPVAPGRYFMVARSLQTDGTDEVRSGLIMFEIYKRENSFAEEPRIETLLYLGDRENWAPPTAEAAIAGSAITFEYVNKDTGESLGDKMPTKPGKYWLVATARALFCDDVQKSVEFAVELSANKWTVDPNMRSYELGGGNVGTPVGEAFKGTVVFEYAKQGDLENRTTEAPTEAGDYVMFATVAATEGYAALSAQVKFTASLSANKWTVDPNMVSYELGEGNVGKPTGAAHNGTVKFEYAKKGEENDPLKRTDKAPTDPGSYVMIATVEETNGYEGLVAMVEFTVSYSKLSWDKLPVIDNWSEEFDPSDPMGEVDGATITYTYKTLDGVELKDKPTTEGTYIMCATVIKDGYEPLYAEYEFTITPAYDTTLLIVDIVLGGAVIAAAIVCIYFAIRRYREC